MLICIYHSQSNQQLCKLVTLVCIHFSFLHHDNHAQGCKQECQSSQEKLWYGTEQLRVNRDDERQWRAEDLEQRVLDNARAIWDRFTERTRYEVNERAEQLRSIGNLSALVAGFAMTSFLQFTFSNDEAVKAVILGFGISTALVVCVSTSTPSGFQVVSIYVSHPCIWSSRRNHSLRLQPVLQHKCLLW